MRASAVGPATSRLLGIRVAVMLSIGWGLAAMLSAVSGMMAASRLELDPNFMLIVLTYAFAAAVLGGIDSPIGAVVGAFIIGIGISLLSGYASSFLGTELQLPLALAVLMLVLIVAAGRALRPGRREARLIRSARGESSGACSLLAAVPLLVVFLPKAFNDYFNYRLAFVGIYFIAIVGLNVLTGYNGQISLGHGAFMAIGAYTTAILNVELRRRRVLDDPDRRDPRPALFGFLFGFPALRLSGVYLALATFGLAASIPLVAKRFEGFTGGGQGKTIALPSSPIGGLSTNEWLSYLTWAIAGLMFGLAWFLLRGSLGRAFRAVRDAPIAAVSSGVSLARYKTLAFGIAAAYAGVAGALLTIAIAFVNPDTFPVSLSILLLTGAVVGGLGSLEGMLFGAVFIQFAPGWADHLSKHLHYNEATVQSTVFYGLILLAVLFLMPGGAATALAPTRQRLETSKGMAIQSRRLTRDSVTSSKKEREMRRAGVRPRRRRDRSGCLLPGAIRQERRRPGVTPKIVVDRRDLPVHRPGLELCADPGRDAGVLQLRQREEDATASAASSAARSSSTPSTTATTRR